MIISHFHLRKRTLQIGGAYCHQPKRDVFLTRMLLEEAAHIERRSANIFELQPFPSENS